VPALAGAQVAPDSVYQGRLTNESGVPLAGPVQLTLRIYDVATAGSPHYSEDHLGVAVDTNGLFSVRLGTGASSVGTYDPNLFSVTPRFLEIEVNGQVLSPRQAVGSVPTALVAADVVIDPSSNIGTAVANAQATADAAAASHTVDTTLDDAAVDAFVSNNGFSTGAHIPQLTAPEIAALGFASGPHTVDSKLDEAAVDAFVANNGFSTGAHIPQLTAPEIAALGFVSGPHTLNTTLDEAAVDAFVSNNGYGSALQIQRLARGWNLTCTSVSISTEVFNASGCTRNGLSFSCDDVLVITSMGSGIGNPCDSAFSPPFAAFNTRDSTTKNCSCSND
jgi:hypothetical protein